MGDGAMNTWNQLITVWRQNVGYDASGNVIAGTTADGRKVQFDFEGDDQRLDLGQHPARDLVVVGRQGADRIEDAQGELQQRLDDRAPCRARRTCRSPRASR